MTDKAHYVKLANTRTINSLPTKQRYGGTTLPLGPPRSRRIISLAAAWIGASAVEAPPTSQPTEDHGLISRQRQGRLANITLLDESGRGQAYTYPWGRGRGRYFKLSEQFWTAPDRWYRTLSNSAKGMLLIASSLKPGFVLPLEQAPKWYGISPDVAGDGLGELERKGLLSVTRQHRREPLSPTNYVVQNNYTLLAPFAQDWRTSPTLATVTDIRDAAAGGA